MNAKQVFFLSGAALINDLTFLFNVFLFFSYTETGILMYIDFAPWVFAGLLFLLLNKWFLQKPRKISTYAALNVFFGAVLIATGFLFLFHVQGIAPAIYATVFIIYTVIRAAFLGMHPITERQMIIYTEMSVLGTGFFFFTQIGGFEIEPIFNLPCIISVLLNMLALIRIRVFGENHKVVAASKWQGNFVLIALLALISGLVLSFFVFLSSTLRGVIIKIISVAADILLWIGIQINKLFLFLISLFPFDDEALPFNMESNVNEMKPSETIEKEPDLLKFYLIAAAVIIVVISVFLIIKYWGKITGNLSIGGSAKVRYEKNSYGLINKLKIFIRNIVGKIKFWLLFIRLRNTAEGVFVLIELWGKKKGIPRKLYETPGAYLKALHDGNLQEEAVKSLVLRLIKELDEIFYGKGKESFNNEFYLKKGEVKQLARYFVMGKN